jgi:hypothetical protein
MSVCRENDAVCARSSGFFRVWRLLLAGAAATMFAVYAAWNLYWLAHARLAPSLFMAITGLPCATTGCTRSLSAWSRGEWLEALRFNPFSLVFVALLAGSAVQVAAQLTSGRRLSLSPVLAWGWGISLTLGWIYKLASDPAYW